MLVPVAFSALGAIVCVVVVDVAASAKIEAKSAFTKMQCAGSCLGERALNLLQKDPQFA